MAELSPMMQQYKNLKKDYKDYILLYRLGDFYEMFFEDALIASKELDITLTGRDCGLDERAPMCGVPYHSVDAYIARLVQKGYKVTICEQIKDPSTNEVCERKVVKIVTPGTVTEPNMLDETKNSYIVGICADDTGVNVTFCFIDITTGEILLTDVYKSDDYKIINELGKFNPKEAFVNKNVNEIPLLLSYFKDTNNSCLITNGDDETYDYNSCKEKIEKHMNKNLSELGITDNSLIIRALGALLSYIYKTQLCDISHINNIIFLDKQRYMDIDLFTWRSLEITETIRSKSKKGSLLGILDKTETAMGARLLRRFLEKPLINISDILKRQNAVVNLYEKNILRAEIKVILNEIKDVERIISKVAYDTINPRDLRNLSFSFSDLPDLKKILNNLSASYLISINDGIDDLNDICSLINNSIVDEPPISIREGKIIKEGYNKEVDELRTLLTDTRAIIANLEAEEKQKTGIKNLKISYNKVFGYFIEVSNSNLNMVPERFIRKQTLTNAERFITEELKEIETKLLTANEKIVQLEYDIFCEIKAIIAKSLSRIKNTANSIALLDVLVCFAEVSQRNNYVCPHIDSGDIINIKDGRHPVVEDILKNEIFIPNDTFLDNTQNRTAIITGPNMAGKSTYMRQVALILIMAQVGCFVPAASAKLGIVDKVFTRVGASDDLTSGQSTFMIEMNEVAYMLKNSTKKSLLIFDEIGRGTSTFDGMSIAQAVLEYVTKNIKAKTLFATHYHELIKLENDIEGIKNYNVAARKKDKDITFLRKIMKGGTDDSYGIEVAMLAGVPTDVIKRAEAILMVLESDKSDKISQKINKKTDNTQIVLTNNINDEIIEKLKIMDVTVLTPIEAMNELYKLSNKAKET
ncbi:MAG: mismatch repair protein MutS [Clostridia bacterium]|nr:mismatch repair protein MutS [Clostridia bacterium]